MGGWGEWGSFAVRVRGKESFLKKKATVARLGAPTGGSGRERGEEGNCVINTARRSYFHVSPPPPYYVACFLVPQNSSRDSFIITRKEKTGWRRRCWELPDFCKGSGMKENNS